MSPLQRGLSWVAAALACFTLMALSSRELTQSLPTWQILFWRSLVSVLVLSLVLGQQRRLPSCHRLHWHFWRNLAHFGGQYGWFHALALLPLAQVISLEFTAPLWALLLAPLLVRERLTSSRLLACLFGFVGILIILQPTQGINPAALGMLAAAASYALAHLLTKRLSGFSPALDILFWMSLMQGLMAAMPVLTDWHWPAAISLPWILLVAASSLLGHYCLIRAFRLIDLLLVLPLDFLRLPLLGFCGYWLYGEPMTASLVWGAAIILAGNALNLLAEHRAARAVRPPRPEVI